jgi:hypothetical protein
MNAAEIIEQIKRLPPEEKKEVREFLNGESVDSGEPSVQYIPRADLERSAKEIFKKHETLFRKLAQ